MFLLKSALNFLLRPLPKISTRFNPQFFPQASSFFFCLDRLPEFLLRSTLIFFTHPNPQIFTPKQTPIPNLVWQTTSSSKLTLFFLQTSPRTHPRSPRRCRRQPFRSPWFQNRSLHRRLRQRILRVLDRRPRTNQRLRPHRLLPRHVPQQNILHLRLQRTQLRNRHSLLFELVRLPTSRQRHKDWPV